MILAFKLTMPGRNSWNGGWSGDGRLYVKTRSFRSQKAEAKARALVGNHYYCWSDGWAANIEVREVDRSEAQRLRNRSQGFCGYEWMIDSLIWYGEILATHERAEKVSKP